MTDNYHPCPWCLTVFPTDRGLGMHFTGPCTQGDPHPPRNKVGRKSRCQTCSLNHIPRCKREDRWPLAPLLAAVNVPDFPRLVGVSGAVIEAAHIVGLSDTQADRWAVRAGLHPAMVWPDWIDAGLTERDRRFLETGWRRAWLHLDRPRLERAA